MGDVCEEMSKTVGLEIDKFQIKVFTDDIEILITTKDPCDCVEMAWRILDRLRLKGYKPEVLILP